MSRMRGVAPFAELWKRRVEVPIRGVGTVAVLSLPDLVRAKKTQRDKDWPMIRRLVDADIARAGARADPARLSFWFAECRSFEVLRLLARRYPEEARRAARIRPAVRAALRNDPRKTELLFRKEEDKERERDRIYWKPLRLDLERWRLERR
ncbi:MAG TPA: hypothetical protein VNO22_01270 [Planctomycetota bacterium]|nr:hypothetical protein [Planctomycetota bacterium]